MCSFNVLFNPARLRTGEQRAGSEHQQQLASTGALGVLVTAQLGVSLNILSPFLVEAGVWCELDPFFWLWRLEMSPRARLQERIRESAEERAAPACTLSLYLVPAAFFADGVTSPLNSLILKLMPPFLLEPNAFALLALARGVAALGLV